MGVGWFNPKFISLQYHESAVKCPYPYVLADDPTNPLALHRCVCTRSTQRAYVNTFCHILATLHSDTGRVIQLYLTFKALTHTQHLGIAKITQHLSTTDGDGSFCQVNRLARLSAGNWMEPRVRYWILYGLDCQCKCTYFVVTIGARVVLWLVGQTEETIKWWFLKRQIAFGKNGKICLIFRCSICGSYLLMGITEKIKTFTLKNLIMSLK